MVVGALGPVAEKRAADMVRRVVELAAIIVAVAEGLAVGELSRDTSGGEHVLDPAPGRPAAVGPKAAIGSHGQRYEPLDQIGRYGNGTKAGLLALFERVEDDKPFIGVKAIQSQCQGLRQATSGDIEQFAQQAGVLWKLRQRFTQTALLIAREAFAVGVELASEFGGKWVVQGSSPRCTRIGYSGATLEKTNA